MYVTDVPVGRQSRWGVVPGVRVGVVNTHPIAALAQSRNAVACREIQVAMVSGPVGGEVLAKAGFGKG